MDALSEVLRVGVVLLAPFVFFVAIWYDQPAIGAAKVGALFFVMGVIGGYLQAPKWDGLLSFLVFDRATIYYWSDVVAMAYGFLAYAAFRSMFPKRKKQ
jgi:hypothetical protein